MLHGVVDGYLTAGGWRRCVANLRTEFLRKIEFGGSAAVFHFTRCIIWSVDFEGV
jgi:hypothetical protein